MPAMIEGFDSILSSLLMAKELHDINRHDVVESQFFDMLCLDDYFENIVRVISAVFSDYFSNCDDDYMDVMLFHDNVISDYFLHAHKQILLQKLDYDKNPYVLEARKEVQRWLEVSHCTGAKLLAYTKTKRTARKSRLIVFQDTSCSCNAYEHIAYGLIKVYGWFAKKCAEFKALEATQNKANKKKSRKRQKIKLSEVMAA
jgi:hypothetical protein